MKSIFHFITQLCILSVIFFISSESIIFAQPHIKGQVHIDMSSGLFECDFEVSNISEIEAYQIMLNKGMNIKYFRDSNNQLIPYKGYYNGEMKGESLMYTLTDENEKVESPSSFSLEYVGAFPRYTDSLNLFDFAGYVAINNKTLRTTAQTAWYPVIYDVKNDRILNRYTYDITLSVEKETSLFLNGSIPQKGTSAHFISKKARPLLLFIGDYDFISNDGNYLLNIDVDQEKANNIINTMNSVKSILAENIGTEFTDNIFMMSHTDVNKNDQGLWAFNQYPTFAFSDLDFGYVIEAYGELPTVLVKVFGHEFSHNYFDIKVYSGNLAEFWGESFPEYLSFIIAEELGSKEYLKSTLVSMANSVKNEDFIPLPQIENTSQMGDQYRYMLGPLILQCFADTFGREKMNSVIKLLLNYAPNQTLSLDLWKQSALKSGISESDFNEFYQHFVEHEDFKDHVIAFIIKNYNQ